MVRHGSLLVWVKMMPFGTRAPRFFSSDLMPHQCIRQKPRQEMTGMTVFWAKSR